MDVQWLIGGEAGYGIMTTGLMMGKVMTRLGLSVFDYVEYPSLIRGGHNAYYVRGSDHIIYSKKRPIDILVALNRETIEKHLHELSPQAAVLFDPVMANTDQIVFPEGVHVMEIPFVELVKSVGATRLMVNTMAVGASLALFSNDYHVLHGLLQELFGRKGETVVNENVNTTRAGFDYVKSHFHEKITMLHEQRPQEEILLSGAEAAALGAMRAGVKFAAIYPMTPINGIMQFLIAHALQYQIVTIEPEDEIAGINMAVGAGFAGVRSLVATSGGGFALMTEALGLAAQTETPLVIIEAMRPGPATGLPTWTGQGDLQFLLHAAPDDFPRIVLAPGDALESFTMTMQAFNLAEKYQMPVIVTVDKYLMEGRMTVKSEELRATSDKYNVERGKVLSDEELAKEVDYKRYLLTDDGVSPRSIPGQKGGIGLSGSDEHDERGLYNEDLTNRKQMMQKRFKKLDLAKQDITPIAQYGPDEAALTLVGFGTTKLVVLEAMEWLKKNNIMINYLQIQCLTPFPTEIVATILRNAEQTMVVEGNYTGQLEGLIKEFTGLSMRHRLRKFDGRPFYPEEIVEVVKTILRK